MKHGCEVMDSVSKVKEIEGKVSLIYVLWESSADGQKVTLITRPKPIVKFCCVNSILLDIKK